MLQQARWLAAVTTSRHHRRRRHHSKMAKPQGAKPLQVAFRHQRQAACHRLGWPMAKVQEATVPEAMERLPVMAPEATATEATAMAAPATEATATEAMATKAPATEATATRAPVTEATATTATATKAKAQEAAARPPATV